MINLNPLGQFYIINFYNLFLHVCRVNRKMVAGYIEGHPIISIPTPHSDDHPGLAQFTGNSIVPMLRFYSLAFRIFIVMSLALVLILRPFFKFIGIHGLNSPAVFQKKVGHINWDFRSSSENNWTLSDDAMLILKSIEELILWVEWGNGHSPILLHA